MDYNHLCKQTGGYFYVKNDEKEIKMNRYIHISYKYKVAMINSIKQDFL